MLFAQLKGEVSILGRNVSVAALTGSVAAVLSTTWIIRQLNAWRRRQESERIYRQKRARNLEAINELYTKLKNDPETVSTKDRITSLSIKDLLAELRNEQISAVDVVRAYQLKALEVNERLNCVVEPCMEAESIAEELDRAETKGPLYGLPISFKDLYPMKGYEAHVGLAKLVGIKAEDDCAVVEILKKMGAIPIVKTTVPQTMFSFECSNPVDGLTLHPLDPERTPGGSSGGEAALIGGGGSLLGFGGDIAGSIRLPAYSCGICGIKPTSKRVSFKGYAYAYQGEFPAVPCIFGPLAQEVDGLVLALRALFTEDMYTVDGVLPPVGFRDEIFEERRSLRIGYLEADGGYFPLPPCQRAVRETTSTLQNMGHTLVPFQWGETRMSSAMEIIQRAMYGDGVVYLKSFLEDERVDPSLFAFLGSALYPGWCNRLIATILGRPRGIFYSSRAGCKNTFEWWQLTETIMALRDECIDLWRKNGLDALICPVGTYIPMRHGDSEGLLGDERFWGMAFTAFYNVLDFPAGVVPVTKVSKKDIDDSRNFPTPRGPEKVAKEMMVGGEGLPVGVQVVTLPWQEERCLRVMKDIETGLRQYQITRLTSYHSWHTEYVPNCFKTQNA